MLFGQWRRDQRHRAARHWVLTVGLAGLGLLVALVVPDISIVFELVGGTASAFVCFIMPAAIAWRLRERMPQMRSVAARCACIAVMLSNACAVDEGGVAVWRFTGL